MMDETALPQAETTANQPDEGDAAPYATEAADKADEAPFLTVRYNKQDRPVSERLAEATKKLGEYRELEELTKGYAQRRGLPDTEAVAALRASLEEDAQAVITAQLKAFMWAFPDENPRELPPAVMDSWKRGVPLTEAYLSYRAAELEKRLKSYEANARNAAMSMGSATGSGDAAEKPLTDEVIARMSPAELERNHKRIWAYLTGKR
jgi:hypothetical protein